MPTRARFADVRKEKSSIDNKIFFADVLMGRTYGTVVCGSVTVTGNYLASIS